MDARLGQENNLIIENIGNLDSANNIVVNLNDIGVVNQFGSVDSLEETSIQSVITDSNFPANSSGIFSVDSQTYLAINDSVAGYSLSSDIIVNITGIEGTIADIKPSSEHIIATPEAESKTINVDRDFGGDLERAIASASNGDVVQLGSTTYFTDGIFINKNITIDGREGTVIDGGGTSESIFSLNQEASGTTIQDLRITNGNNGINSNGAFDLTIQNLEVDNIGLNQTIRDGQNNTGIILNRANGLQLRNTYVHDIGRKGIGINDTNGATVSSLFVQNINLAAEHAQSFDAAGIKFFNTNDVLVRDFYLSNINASNIWNDTTNGTIIEANRIENLGDAFARPEFNQNVDISGIYNEKSSNSTVTGNSVMTIGDFIAFNATAFTTESLTLENNDFSSIALNTTDFWVNEEIERLIATTEDPDAANFDLFADEFFAQANIG